MSTLITHSAVSRQSVSNVSIKAMALPGDTKSNQCLVLSKSVLLANKNSLQMKIAAVSSVLL